MTVQGALSIGVDEYHRLPNALRREFDQWLDAEGLTDKHLIWLRLLEGAIEAERYVTDPGGHVVVGKGGDVVREKLVYRIISAPPREALA